MDPGLEIPIRIQDSILKPLHPLYVDSWANVRWTNTLPPKQYNPSEQNGPVYNHESNNPPPDFNT